MVYGFYELEQEKLTLLGECFCLLRCYWLFADCACCTNRSAKNLLNRQSCCLQRIFLCVVVVLLGVPQGGLWGGLFFVFGRFFFVCGVVAAAIFCHVLHGNAGLYLWGHVEFA